MEKMTFGAIPHVPVYTFVAKTRSANLYDIPKCIIIKP
jgi:hypothetical protein